jgi:hypothetical protein
MDEFPHRLAAICTHDAGEHSWWPAESINQSCQDCGECKPAFYMRVGVDQRPGEPINDRVRRLAVNALYDARNDGKVMDEAAVAVVDVVEPQIRRDEGQKVREQLMTGRMRAIAAEAFEREVGLPDGFDWPCGTTDEALRPSLDAVAVALNPESGS